MTTPTLPELAKPLDILEIIQKHTSINNDWAVEEATLQLDITGESFIEVYYYDVSNVYSVQESFDEQPIFKRVNLTIEEVNNMSRDIIEAVDLPISTKSLRTVLREGYAVEFELTYYPRLKG